MSKKSILLVAIAMLFSILLAGCGGGGGDKKAAPAAPAAGGKKLIIYTSMKESLIGGIVEGFKKKNPGIDVDYQSAGAGKLMAKIAAERQSGKILADIIWTSEVPDFYSMKKEGILEQYKTPLFKEILNPFDDYDGHFTAAGQDASGMVWCFVFIAFPWRAGEAPGRQGGVGCAGQIVFQRFKRRADRIADCGEPGKGRFFFVMCHGRSRGCMCHALVLRLFMQGRKRKFKAKSLRYLNILDKIGAVI